MNDPRYSLRHGMFSRGLDSLMVRVFRAINRWRPWHRLGTFLGLANLIAIRVELRKENLHDTDGDLTQPKPGCPFHTALNGMRKRTEEGTHNDLHYPAMGCKFSRLGRNMRTKRPPENDLPLMHPNPFIVSERILARPKDGFIPATILNLIAGAWIQFQVHDWFGHELEDVGGDIDTPENKEKRIEVTGSDGRHMVIPKTRPDVSGWPAEDEWPLVNGVKTQPDLNGRVPVYRNKSPQWWDASQIYGESIRETDLLRRHPGTGKLEPHGKLYLDENGMLPSDPAANTALSGFTDNWWLGLEILHTLFAKEHNSICDALKENEPHLSDQEIFETARLINAAVMAKIHTVEWTPGILTHKCLPPAMNLNWKGIVGQALGEKTARRFAPWIPQGFIRELMTGIPLSETEHHGAPYSLTEEFNAVYRLHPLIREAVQFVKAGHRHEKLGSEMGMADLAFDKTRKVFNEPGGKWEDIIYSFGIAHPGAIMAKNYPAFLRDIDLPDDPETGRTRRHLDLGAIDILRDRERGVPRYCEFRRQLRMEAPTTWQEMAGMFDGKTQVDVETKDGMVKQTLPDLAEELKDLYEDDLEAVDNMVGMFCERPPAGFGFSDTAFRVFILMASRRLKSDRFFTEHYTEDFYTKTGMNWLSDVTMKKVIVRHHKTLEPFIPDNAFAPWS